MLVALTGATGFIGQRIALRLLAEGHQVRALTRKQSSALPASIEQISGSLHDPDALRRLLEGAEALMHLAGAVRGSNAAEFDLTNVEGTERLLAACSERAPAIPVLFFSSLAAREPGLSHYSASKRKAEQVLESRTDGPWMALRPPAVYGPGDKEMLPVFRFMARTGIAPCAGRQSDRLSLIFVDDLVDAAIAWLPLRYGIRAICCLHDGHESGYGWKELAQTVGDACGRSVIVRELPAQLLDLVARANRAVSRITGTQPMLTPEKLRELRHPDWVCDNREISALLGWRPSTPLAQGLAATPGWTH